MSAEKLATKIRREQILQAALSLAATQGLRRLSMAALARRVGLVPSALYRHFRSKDEILDAVPDLIQARFEANLSAARASSPEVLAQVRNLLMRHVQLIRENEGIPRVVFSEDFFAAQPERRRRLYRTISAYLAQIEDMIRLGQKNGEIRPDVDPATVAGLFLGIVQPAVILWHMSDGGFDVTRHAERTWRFLSESLQVNRQ